MAALHLVNNAAALASCLDCAGAGDAVLLIEDGVYAATTATARPLYVLEEDVERRGLSASLGQDCQRASYGDFVALVAEHQPIVSWS